jgi:hypothetical protein
MYLSFPCSAKGYADGWSDVSVLGRERILRRKAAVDIMGTVTRLVQPALRNSGTRWDIMNL